MIAGIDVAAERHMLARLDDAGAPIGKPLSARRLFDGGPRLRETTLASPSARNARSNCFTCRTLKPQQFSRPRLAQLAPLHTAQNVQPLPLPTAHRQNVPRPQTSPRLQTKGTSKLCSKGTFQLCRNRQDMNVDNHEPPNL